MWFMQKIVNPLVVLILRSPFHRMMSDGVLLITYRGRRSGREFTLPVQYARADDTVTIVPGQAERKTWWRSLRGGAAVELLLAGNLRAGQAIVLECPANASRIAQALTVYFERFPPSARMRGLRAAADGSFHPEDLLESAAVTIVVQVELRGLRRDEAPVTDSSTAKPHTPPAQTGPFFSGPSRGPKSKHGEQTA